MHTANRHITRWRESPGRIEVSSKDAAPDSGNAGAGIKNVTEQKQDDHRHRAIWKLDGEHRKHHGPNRAKTIHDLAETAPYQDEGRTFGDDLSPVQCFLFTNDDHASLRRLNLRYPWGQRD
jgi:hypothetical protein